MDKILLFILLVINVILDYRSDRISNRMCLLGGMIGLFLVGSQKGLTGIEDVIIGIIVIMGILLPFWILHIIGGGDVKLMMMASCYLGIHVLKLLAVSAVCSAVYSIFLLGMRRNVRRRMTLLLTYCRECVLEGTMQAYPFDKNRREDREDGGIHISYTVLAGYVIGIAMGIFV